MHLPAGWWVHHLPSLLQSPLSMFDIQHHPSSLRWHCQVLLLGWLWHTGSRNWPCCWLQPDRKWSVPVNTVCLTVLTLVQHAYLLTTGNRCEHGFRHCVGTLLYGLAVMWMWHCFFGFLLKGLAHFSIVSSGGGPCCIRGYNEIENIVKEAWWLADIEKSAFLSPPDPCNTCMLCSCALSKNKQIIRYCTRNLASRVL